MVTILNSIAIHLFGKRFSNLRSRCTTSISWRYLTASHNWYDHSIRLWSGIAPTRWIYVKRSPCEANSSIYLIDKIFYKIKILKKLFLTIKIFPLSIKWSYILIIFLWVIRGQMSNSRGRNFSWKSFEARCWSTIYRINRIKQDRIRMMNKNISYYFNSNFILMK